MPREMCDEEGDGALGLLLMEGRRARTGLVVDDCEAYSTVSIITSKDKAG